MTPCSSVNTDVSEEADASIITVFDAHLQFLNYIYLEEWERRFIQNVCNCLPLYNGYRRHEPSTV